MVYQRGCMLAHILSDTLTPFGGFQCGPGQATTPQEGRSWVLGGGSYTHNSEKQQINDVGSLAATLCGTRCQIPTCAYHSESLRSGVRLAREGATAVQCGCGGGVGKFAHSEVGTR